MGRPIKDIDPGQVEKLAGIGCTVEEIAHVLDCGERTLRRRFGRALKGGRLNARASLRRKQWETAMGTAGKAPSAAMQIWLGKQMLGQKDKAEVSGADGGPIETTELGRAGDDALDREIEKLTGAIQDVAKALRDEEPAGPAAAGEAEAAG